MISTSDFKRGVTVEVDGTLYRIEDVHHVKTKKSAVYRVKLRDLRAGHITERTFNAGDRLTAARVETRPMQYLYAQDDLRVFMNTETYEQIEIQAALIADVLPYIKEGALAQVITYGEEPLGVEVGPAVELKVEQSDPGLRGDTQSGATKPAKMETGLVVDVPLFINVGDTIKVGTADGNYIERIANP